jgi:hypothetical protein
MPSQLRHLLRAQGRDLHAEFIELLPERPAPISIQRWSLRRVGLALTVLLGLLIVVPMVVNWSVQTDRFDTSLYTSDVGCADREALWLMAQAVPSATLVPCVQLLPEGWSLGDVKVADGRARIVFDTDRPFEREAVMVQLAASCDLAGAREVTSEQPRPGATSGSTATRRHPRSPASTPSRGAASPSGSRRVRPAAARNDWLPRRRWRWGSPAAKRLARPSTSAPAAAWS